MPKGVDLQKAQGALRQGLSERLDLLQIMQLRHVQSNLPYINSSIQWNYDVGATVAEARLG